MNPIFLIIDYATDSEGIVGILRQIAANGQFKLFFDRDQALDAVEKECPEIVFVHLQAGVPSATLLLDEVWKRNPKGMRFVLGTSAERGVLVKCLLGGHQLVQLPVNEASLRETLESGKSVRRFVRNDRVQGLISRMRTLPTKPSIYADLLREARSEGASASSVAKLVAKDFSISTRLVQLANSPLFGSQLPISEIEEAVLFLGMETVISSVLSIEAFEKFDKTKPIYFSVENVWKHSQIVAEMTKKICQTMRVGSEASAQAYLAALLHDIGKLIFAENFGDEYHRAVKQGESSEAKAFAVEEERFGATHTEAGAYLLALWALPEAVVEAVANHHSAAEALGAELTPAVVLHLAEQLVDNPGAAREIIASYPPELALCEHQLALEALVPEDLKQKAAQKRKSTTSSTLRMASYNPAQTESSKTEKPSIPAPVAAAPKSGGFFSNLFRR